MSHREIFDPEDDHWQALGRSFERDKQIEAVVKQKVEAFIDSQLPKAPLQDQGINPPGGVHLLPTGAQSTESIARDIATLVMERLNTLESSQKRSEVWNLVVEYVEADAEQGHLARSREPQISKTHTKAPQKLVSW